LIATGLVLGLEFEQVNWIALNRFSICDEEPQQAVCFRREVTGNIALSKQLGMSEAN